ncbi:MAG TPA: hypothetical protein VI756_27110 [Blastocatellia bacterium]
MENSRLTKPGIYVDQAGSSIRRLSVGLGSNAVAFQDKGLDGPQPVWAGPASMLRVLRGYWRLALHHDLERGKNETE